MPENFEKRRNSEDLKRFLGSRHLDCDVEQAISATLRLWDTVGGRGLC